ncbi:MAG: YdcH family protein [Sphingomicrobium sp.]
MNDDETAAQQLAALKLEHRSLDGQITALIEYGSIDQLELARLKKRKLRLKDEIERMRDRSVPDIIA